jgi:molybdate transport system ATP-binding protein
MNLSVHVRKRLSPPFVLDVRCDVAPGVTIVFGESGSGKTTLLRSVAGLARPDEGRIAIGDRTLFDAAAGIDLAPAARRVGFVFQHLALFPHLTAADNIEYGLAQLAPAERRQRTAAIAASFRISHLLPRRPGEISGGERQRVGLARSLVTDPDVLLLDEPLSALDHSTQSRIIQDLRQWNDSRRIPILYVTHSQREAFALGERVLVVEAGAIVADGTPHDVMERPARESVARLAGFENLLDAVVVRRDAFAGVMVCRLIGTSGATVDLETPLANVDVDHAVRIAIRAGDIIIATERPRGLSARNVLAGTIASLSQQGSIVRAEVKIGVPLEVHLTPTAAHALGLRAAEDVWLVIKTHSCRLVSAV